MYKRQAIGALMVAAVTMGEYADVAEAFDKIREGTGSKAVSYTHLDVYKRQL